MAKNILWQTTSKQRNEALNQQSPIQPRKYVRLSQGIALVACVLWLIASHHVGAKPPQLSTKTKRTPKPKPAKNKTPQSRWQKLVASLQHGDAKKRTAALRTLQTMAPPLRLPWNTMHKALQDGSWKLRRSAVRLMGRLPRKQRSQRHWHNALVARIKDKDWHVRDSALKVMQQSLKPSKYPRQVVLQTLSDRIWEVRERGLSLLARMTPTQAATQALRRLLRDPIWQVRSAAVWAMYNQNDWSKANVDALLKALADAEPTVRLLAERALVRAGAITGLLQQTQHASHIVKRHAIHALGSIAPNTLVIDRLRAILADPDPTLREAAGEALGRHGPNAKHATKDLIKSLADQSHAVQSIAVWTLGRIGKAAVTPLARAMRHNKEAVKLGAAKALSAMGANAAPATPFLIDALLDTRWRVRREATWALYRIGAAVKRHVPYSMLPILLNALRDHQWKVRFGLLKVIGQIGPQARIVIGWFGPKVVSTVGLLRQLRKDKHPLVRRAAQEALQKLALP